MSDAGMFEPIISRLMRVKWFGKSVFSVVLIASLVTMITHLDGQGITTLMVTVPPMLIIFDKLHISRLLLGMVFVTIAGSLNILPWSGPVIRAATVIDVDVMVLFRSLLPTMALGLVLSFIALYVESRKEQKTGAFTPADAAAFMSIKVSEEAAALRRPKMFWFNIALTVIVLVLLFLGIPGHLTFLAGCAIALPANYRSVKEQTGRIKAHAGNILDASYTIIGAGILLGVMEGGGIFTALGTGFANLIPDAFDKYIHLIFGLFIAPLSYLLNSDAMLYGIMPVVVNTGGEAGVSATKIAAMFVAGRVITTGLCLTTPSVYLGLGLMGITYRDAIKRAFIWTLVISMILVYFAALTVP
jgi:CitMHS family citrate-Mg2+:H+ or citrate-Ca2+:H+ symporter